MNTDEVVSTEDTVTQQWTVHHYNWSPSNLWSKGASGYTVNINFPIEFLHRNACISEKVRSLLAYAYDTASRLAPTSRIDAYRKYAH